MVEGITLRWWGGVSVVVKSKYLRGPDQDDSTMSMNCPKTHNPVLLVRGRHSDVTLNSALETPVYRFHPYPAPALSVLNKTDRKAHPPQPPVTGTLFPWTNLPIFDLT
jgi:hypothetical protein